MLVLKKGQEFLKMVSAKTLVDSIPVYGEKNFNTLYIVKYVCVHVCFLDDDLRNVRLQKVRDRYANIPPDKKAKLNARKRENYHRMKAEKQSAGSLHVAT